MTEQPHVPAENEFVVVLATIAGPRPTWDNVGKAM